MKRWQILLVAAIMAFGSSTGVAEEMAGDGQQGGFLKGLTDVLGGVAKEGFQEAMDEWLGTYEGRIGQVNLVERRGNTLVLDVTYEKVKRKDGVYVDGRVLDGGFPVDGFESTLSPIRGKRGKVRLTLRKSGSEEGWGVSASEVESDQVELYLIREGHEDRPFGSLVYDLAKTWTNSDAPDELPAETGEAGEMIELAEGEETEAVSGAGGTGVAQKPRGPYVIPGTVLIPARTSPAVAGTQATRTVQPRQSATPAVASSRVSNTSKAQMATVSTLPAKKVSSYDFFANASRAKWKGTAGNLSFPGRVDDRRGFVRTLNSGKINPNNAAKYLLQTHPEWKDRGRIAGQYPDMVLGQNVRFRAVAGFLKGARNLDGATFAVQIHESGRYRTVLRKRVPSSKYVQLEADLSEWAGKKVAIILRVDAGKTSTQDWAVWVKPRLEKISP